MRSGMTPVEFARRHLGEFTERYGEIRPKLCPYCHGGRSHDKYTFAMNADTGKFNCRRGKCAVSGTFYKLKLDFGEVDTVTNYGERGRASQSFAPSTAQVIPPGEKALEYLSTRKISKATADKYSIGDDGKNNIVFPYIKDGRRVAVKYRPARKVEKGEQKMYRETGTDTTTLFGMQLIENYTKLVITEGEIDCLSLAEAGIKNTVSVPNGSKDFGWIEANWNWLDQFKEIIICGDTDEPGQEMARRLIQRLGAARCSVVELPHDCKDANECLYRHGADRLSKAVSCAKPAPFAGILRIAEADALDLDSMERFKTGIPKFDDATGGLFFGQVTVVTGSNGSGKSTLMGQFLLEAVHQDYPVCAFSGELPAPLFRYWIDLQAAGPNNLSFKPDPIFTKDKPYVTTENAKKIRAWYYDKFFLYDNATAITPDNVFSVFEYAAMRYGCRLFLVDNLMMLIDGDDGEYYHRQSSLIKRCCAFAKRYNVHILICAHPRKVEGRLTKMDVSGSGDITNLADCVVSLYRVPEKEKTKLKGSDAVLDIFKSRFSGRQEVEIGLRFESESKRFYQQSDPVLLDRTYGWMMDKDGMYDIPDDAEVPF